MLLLGRESAAVAIGRSRQHHDVVVDDDDVDVVDDDGDKDVGDDDANQPDYNPPKQKSSICWLPPVQKTQNRDAWCFWCGVNVNNVNDVVPPST